MFKLKSCMAAICMLLIFATVNASEYVRVDAESSARGICGLTIAKVRGLVLEARAIPPDSAQSRVDNDRFDACPYQVLLHYAGKTMSLDFSREFALGDVRKYDGSVEIKAGYLSFDDEEWSIASDMLASEDARMLVHDSESSLFVAGSFRRKLLIEGKTDFCVAIAVIGRKRYAVSSLCGADKEALSFLDTVLVDEKFLQFEE
jgi:hypothetical protein